MAGDSIKALSGLLGGGAAVSPSASGVLVIDLDALISNYEALCKQAGPAECAAVVKGDGYGLGAVPVASALAKKGCRVFFVATLAEAEALRSVLPISTIYVLDGLFPGSAADFTGLSVWPVLGDIAEIEEWSERGRRLAAKLPAALHIDMGMNRLGLKADGQQRLLSDLSLLDGFRTALLMSHLACADTPDHTKNAEQRKHFADFAAKLPKMPLSLANSAGTLIGPDYHFDLVRPGVALYGGNPFASRPNPMKPVIGLYGRIAQIGEAHPGETVGYGAAVTLTRPTRYVTVSAGYADGYFRALGSSDAQAGARAYLDGRPIPILGRISMDLIVFDVTDVPPDAVRRGGFVELFGPSFTADDAAALAGTISYEILTSLGSRYTRIYLGADSGAS